jgi:hypothetical protein
LVKRARALSGAGSLNALQLPAGMFVVAVRRQGRTVYRRVMVPGETR